MCLQERVEAHEKDRYKSSAFSLHYHMWNKVSRSDKTCFVTVLEIPDGLLETEGLVSKRHQHLLLNLAEMWICLIFQTLPQVQFDQYTPANIEKGWAGRHLNIAVPLWQSYREVEDPDIWDERAQDIGKESFKQFLFSPDPETRLWAEGLRDAFHNLRDSRESRIRKYYKMQINKWIEAGRKAQRDQGIQRWQKWYTEGKEVVVKRIGKRCYYQFVLGNYQFTISNSLNLGIHEGDKIYVKFKITDGPNPMRYVISAQGRDPSMRLGVLITGHDERGPFQAWLRCHGDKNAQRMNAVVDRLEGHSIEEIRNFPRRCIEEKRFGKSRWRYTS